MKSFHWKSFLSIDITGMFFFFLLSSFIISALKEKQPDHVLVASFP